MQIQYAGAILLSHQNQRGASSAAQSFCENLISAQNVEFSMEMVPRFDKTPWDSNNNHHHHDYHHPHYPHHRHIHYHHHDSSL